MLTWLRQRLATIQTWLRPLRAVACEDLPEALQSAHIYLIGEEGLAWQAAMLCPCGCDATIQLSLIKRDRPSWSQTTDSDGRVTLTPSVWRTTGCHSHFFVRNGRIVWAR